MVGGKQRFDGGGERSVWWRRRGGDLLCSGNVLAVKVGKVAREGLACDRLKCWKQASKHLQLDVCSDERVKTLGSVTWLLSWPQDDPGPH